MLVLSRRKNESIIIDDDITITVIEIRGDKVRLGVEAPKEVPVHRREVLEIIRKTELEDESKGLGGKLNTDTSKQFKLDFGFSPIGDNYLQTKYPLNNLNVYQ